MMELRKNLILRSPRSGRLEGRIALIQQPHRYIDKFSRPHFAGETPAVRDLVPRDGPAGAA